MSFRSEGQGNSTSNNEEVVVQFSKNGESDSVNERTTSSLDCRICTILDPKGEFLKWWNVAFVLSCVIAVSLDPLFFYLPVIIEEKKCIGLDKKLWTTAIVLRSINDVIYLMHIILQFRTGFLDENLRKSGKPELNTDARKIARRYLWPYFLFDILVILPIPQVVIPIIFSEMSGTKSSNRVKFMNLVVLFQYGPRVVQIYLSWKKLIRSIERFDRNLRIKAPLNLILYIIAGHVLGAFWYFFSTQRLTACWHIACENHSGCGRSSFNCDHNFEDLSFLNDMCPINSPNATSFNFGIFLDALQSGVLESTDFPEKLFYSFWWGMRNLSSLGQNLQTSNYIWENCFALCISIFGLLLFLYFLGNLQIYMQWTTTKSIKKWDKVRMKMKSSKRKNQKENTELWFTKYDLPSKMKSDITANIDKRFAEDEDVYVENLIPGIPDVSLQNDIKRHICLNLLKQLNIIKENGLAKREQLLLKICDSLRPVFYNEHSYIIREGDPIDAVFLITSGIVWCSTSRNIGEEETASRHAERLKRGQFFGEELIEWVWKPSSLDMYNLSRLPVSSKTLKTHKKVEAFALMAEDFRSIVYSKLSRFGPERSEFKAACTLQGAWRDHKNPRMKNIKNERSSSNNLGNRNRLSCCGLSI